MSRVERKKIEMLHKALCRELGIPPCKVTTRHGGHKTNGWFSHALQKIYVRPVPLTSYSYPWKVRSWRWIVAHETYHWYQHYIGMLTGREYKGQRKSWWPVWSKRPWEIAANRFADGVAAKKGWKR